MKGDCGPALSSPRGKIKLPALNLIVKLLNGNYSGIAKWMMARGKPDLSI